MGRRWQMERAGLVNFWFYDEAEFVLSAGRLILRGANGSGKSVTMQSFLPLVLDGDKRPWRLDPFGSKDRRVDYYLLGDADSGITDRTGYLYLEFYHPQLRRYLTIGIGLRARRNSPNVKFWGFAVTDNRRVGKDIFLYERDYSQGKESKIPLSRSQLEELIGPGGWVVTEQGEYKKLVNKLLFGFEDIQAYQELLDLLIQLRSPKLSKDFKPSTIYDILAAALPALQEEELRPLSETLEDMDQISDRLNELSIHRREAEGLHKAYTRYNEFLLYQAAEEILQEKRQRDEQRQLTGEKEADIQELGRETKELNETLAQDRVNRRRAQDELEIMSEHQALEKEKELERLTEQERIISGDIRKTETRRLDWEQKKERALQEKDRLSKQIALNQKEQEETIFSMEAAARECEFVVHDVYHRYREREVQESEGVWQSWRRDIDKHERKLEEAHRLAREEASLRVQVEGAERELSNARQLRDQREGEVRRAEQGCEQAHRETQDSVFTWRKGLRQLPLTDDAFQQVLHLLHTFPEADYQMIKSPVLETNQASRDRLSIEMADWKQKQKNYQESRDELHRQWLEWHNLKEPEPPRSVARTKSRARRGEAGEVGAPFYAVCEFQDGVSESVRAAIESTLQHAGLLDAWVSEQGIAFLAADEEEVWIRPNPHLLAHTLADYLYPTPSEGGGLSAATIQDLLSTITLGDDRSGTSAEGCLSEEGTFRLGVLEGKAALKERAEYIGKENRRQTRLKEMARLEELIQSEETTIAHCQAQLEELDGRVQRLKEEVQAFPGIDPLQETYTQLNRKKLTFEAALEEEQRKHEHFRQLSGKLGEVRAQLHQFMEGWSIPRDEPSLARALSCLRSYREHFGGLKSLWATAVTLKASLTRAEEDWQEAAEKVNLEATELENLRHRHRTCQTQIETYTKLLQELGIYDLHQQMQDLKDRIRGLDEKIKEIEQSLKDKEIKMAVCRSNLQSLHELLGQREACFDQAQAAWKREWNRRLVPDWAGQEITADEGEVIKVCQQLRQHYRSRFDNRAAGSLTNKLYEVFMETRQTLHDYVPETTQEPDTGRILVMFMRDRQNPITPQHLVDELSAAEEEQRLLLSEKDRQLYEQIIIHSVGKAIKQKIFRAEQWVHQMNRLMQQRETSSGLRLFLKWEPKAPSSEKEMDTLQLVKLLKTDPHLLRDEQIEEMIAHFRSRITWAKEESEGRDTLRHWVNQLLDYRQWFRFTLYYEKGEQPRRELTDARFNVLSGGEKAMAMYIPLFAATFSRYNDSRADAPKIISLDEAFAGVDEENMRDMFDLLTQLDFDYMMTSQLLWGCYDTVPNLSIYEIYRPKDVNFVTLIRYHWDGVQRRMLVEEEPQASAG
ncbi:MAG: TIGR02680 family protein [Bacillota bacterium]